MLRHQWILLVTGIGMILTAPRVNGQESLRNQIDAEIQAVNDDMAKQKDQLNNLSSQIDVYQGLFNKGLLRKPEITQLQIQRSSVQAELSRLQAEISRLEQSGADIDAKTETVKSNYTRQILGELEATSERLGNINATLGTARQLREFRVQKLSLNGEEPNYLFEITRTDSNGLSTFNANSDTQLKPGDVIDVKLNAHQTESSLPIEAELSRSLLPKADVLNSTNSVKSEETPSYERSKRQSR